jgi:hypothetical protein
MELIRTSLPKCCLRFKCARPSTSPFNQNESVAFLSDKVVTLGILFSNIQYAIEVSVEPVM